MPSTTADPHSRFTPQRWFLVGLCLLFLALSLQYSFKARGNGTRDNRSAFLRWRTQVLELDEGRNIYERHNYPNPPIMALLLRPLAQLPALPGSLTWFYLKAVLTLIAVCWVLRLVEDPERPFPAWGKALAVLLGLRPILGDLSHGNVNLFILFLVVAALYTFCRRYRKSAGLLLALAIACKVTPALFVPYFLWKRAWTTLAGCAAGLVLFLWLIPGCVLGWGYNAELLHSWADRMVVPYVAGGAVTTEHQNQSLPGVLYRLATSRPSFTEFQEEGYVPVEYHNLVELDPALLGWFLKGCMAVFAGVVIWTCRAPADRPGWRLTAEFSLIALGMLLFSERTWKHHYVPLILPLAVLVYSLSARRVGPRLRVYVICTLVLVVALMTATSTGVLTSTERAAKLAEVYGAYLWANLLLMAALVVVLRAPEKDVPEPTPGSALPEGWAEGTFASTESAFALEREPL